MQTYTTWGADTADRCLAAVGSHSAVIARWSKANVSVLVTMPRFSLAYIARSAFMRFAMISCRSPLFHAGSSALCGQSMRPSARHASQRSDTWSTLNSLVPSGRFICKSSL